MKHLVVLLVALILTIDASSKEKKSLHPEIMQMIETFKDCMKHKDSVKFFSLFSDETATWYGVFGPITQADRVKKEASKKNYFTTTYKKFYRSVPEDGSDEEKFYNINIHEDSNIASVTFDYSYWSKGQKINWGKESWGLVRINGEWKISSVIFSLEMEDVIAEKRGKN